MLKPEECRELVERMIALGLAKKPGQLTELQVEKELKMLNKARDKNGDAKTKKVNP